MRIAATLGLSLVCVWFGLGQLTNVASRGFTLAWNMHQPEGGCRASGLFYLHVTNNHNRLLIKLVTVRNKLIIN